jgi:hypothetical protein
MQWCCAHLSDLSTKLQAVPGKTITGPKKRDELRLIKAKEPTIISGRELKDKK